MDKSAIIGNIITALASGLVSAFAVHYLTIFRDLKNKRDEFRTKYLIEVYRKLAQVAAKDKDSGCISDSQKIADFKNVLAECNSAFAEILLFGTNKQASMAQSIAYEFAEKRTVSLDDLLEDLRRDLRKLLKMERLPSYKLVFLHWVQSSS